MKSKGKLDACCVGKERDSRENIFLHLQHGLCRIFIPYSNITPISFFVLTVMTRNTALILIFIICALCISQNGVYAFGAGNIPSLVILDDSFQIIDDLIISVSLIWKEKLSAMVISYVSAHDHFSL